MFSIQSTIVCRWRMYPNGIHYFQKTSEPRVVYTVDWFDRIFDENQQTNLLGMHERPFRLINLFRTLELAVRMN